MPTLAITAGESGRCDPPVGPPEFPVGVFPPPPGAGAATGIGVGLEEDAELPGTGVGAAVTAGAAAGVGRLAAGRPVRDTGFGACSGGRCPSSGDNPGWATATGAAGDPSSGWFRPTRVPQPAPSTASSTTNTQDRNFS